MKKTDELPEDVRQIQEASDAATWDAIEAYRDTGEMVLVTQDGKRSFRPVAEVLRSRPDSDRRKKEAATWRLKNLRDQFAAGGVPLTPDVWDRLEADRRQALEDDLAWIREGRRGELKS